MARILVVDDEEMYRFYLPQFLTRAGFEVRTAASGHEGVLVGQEFVPDLLIADWKLQNQFSGFDVCEILTKTNPRLKTIIMTGFPSPDLERRARQHVCEVFQKPFEPEELVRQVRQILAADAGSEI